MRNFIECSILLVPLLTAMLYVGAWAVERMFVALLDLWYASFRLFVPNGRVAVVAHDGTEELIPGPLVRGATSLPTPALALTTPLSGPYSVAEGHVYKRLPWPFHRVQAIVDTGPWLRMPLHGADAELVSADGRPLTAWLTYTFSLKLETASLTQHTSQRDVPNDVDAALLATWRSLRQEARLIPAITLLSPGTLQAWENRLIRSFPHYVVPTQLTLHIGSLS